MFDISVPTGPKHVGFVALPERTSTITLDGDLGYIWVSGKRVAPRQVRSGDTIHVLDVNAASLITKLDLPPVIAKATFGGFPIGISGSVSMVAHGGWLTISSSDRGLVFLDVRDRLQPKLHRTIDIASTGMYLTHSEESVLVTIKNDSAVAVVNYPSLGSETDEGAFLKYEFRLSLAGDCLVVETKNDKVYALVQLALDQREAVPEYGGEAYLHILTDWGNGIPNVTSSTQMPFKRPMFDFRGASRKPQIVIVNARWLYILEGNRIWPVDVFDSADPKVMPALELADGALAVSMAVSGNYALVATGQRNVLSVDVSNPAQPIVTGRAELDVYSDGTGILGTIGFVTGFPSPRPLDIMPSETILFDLSHSGAPTRLSQFTVSSLVFVHIPLPGRLLLFGVDEYTDEIKSSVYSFDVSDSRKPFQVKRLQRNGISSGYESATGADFMYVARSGCSGPNVQRNCRAIDILDAKKPDNPVVLSSTEPYERWPESLAVLGNSLYSAERNSGCYALRDTGAAVATPIATVPGSESRFERIVTAVPAELPTARPSPSATRPSPAPSATLRLTPAPTDTAPSHSAMIIFLPDVVQNTHAP